MPRGTPKAKLPQGAEAPQSIPAPIPVLPSNPPQVPTKSAPVAALTEPGPFRKAVEVIPLGNLNTGIRTSSGGSLKILSNLKYKKVLLSDDESTLEFPAEDVSTLIESLKSFLTQPR